MGEMSSIVSRRPSLRNQSNDALWMSIRFGSSRTSLIREKDVRARGAATLAVKRYSLPYYSEESEISDRRKRAERQREHARVPNAGAPPQGEPPRRPRTSLDGSAERKKAEARAYEERERPPGGGRSQTGRRRSYLTSTDAPASSSCDLIESASSWATPSLTGLGAPSTRSFASLRPRPVIARTTLITWIFLSPGPWRTTSNDVFSSTAAAPSPAGPGAATAIGAAAVMPHSSSILFFSATSSRTVMDPSESKTVSTALDAITGPLLLLRLSFRWLVLQRAGRPLFPRRASRPPLQAWAFRLPRLLPEPRPRRWAWAHLRPRCRPAPRAVRSGRRSARRGSAAER